VKAVLIENAKRIVVKVGTSLLTGSDGLLDPAAIDRLAAGIGRVVHDDRQVLVVSSGAIGAGLAPLGLKSRPRTLPLNQAAAAVGQSALMEAWRGAFGREGIIVAQLLLTRDGLSDRKRYLNARNTVTALLDHGVVPIINENDTVSVDEIRFGDNDMLSALVANLADADLLVVLTDVPGLMTGDPRTDNEARLISSVDVITPRIEEIVARGASNVGVGGGMRSKIEAARIMLEVGVPCVIADGRDEDPLGRIFDGEEIGTVFAGPAGPMSARRRWIAFTHGPSGDVIVDEGARAALVEHQKSLLPSGVVDASGDFHAGDTVRIVVEGQGEFARGIVNFSTDEVLRLAGAGTDEIEARLGARTFDEVVHRDNLVVL